jgi:hypothetical protein
MSCQFGAAEVLQPESSLKTTTKCYCYLQRAKEHSSWLGRASLGEEDLSAKQAPAHLMEPNVATKCHIQSPSNQKPETPHQCFIPSGNIVATSSLNSINETTTT